jgi:hypothetical protein
MDAHSTGETAGRAPAGGPLQSLCGMAVGGCRQVPALELHACLARVCVYCRATATSLSCCTASWPSSPPTSCFACGWRGASRSRNSTTSGPSWYGLGEPAMCCRAVAKACTVSRCCSRKHARAHTHVHMHTHTHTHMHTQRHIPAAQSWSRGIWIVSSCAHTCYLRGLHAGPAPLQLRLLSDLRRGQPQRAAARYGLRLPRPEKAAPAHAAFPREE